MVVQFYFQNLGEDSGSAKMGLGMENTVQHT
jgi:hypothetical protein